ncbi:MAG: VWA domain-containing protein [Armatimonadetes bacterium]|nr:VWA domain-containing protein [Armatimonadota bacterium]
MEFLAPYFLSLLILVPGVLLLYFLRPRRRDQEVSSTLLWRAVEGEVTAYRPARRLLLTILLLLQIVALALLGISLGRPSRIAVGITGDRIVLVVDTSASMQAADVRPSRFEAARREAERIASTASGNQELALVEAGPQPVVRVPFTRNRNRVRQALAELRPTDGGGSIVEALGTALAMAEDRRSLVLVVLSDGAWSTPPVQDYGGARVVFLPFGRGGDNVGIVAMQASGTARGAQVFVRVQNFASRDYGASLRLVMEGRLIGQRRLALRPGEELPVIFHVSEGTTGIAEAILDVDDLLPVDNRGWAVVGGARAPSALLVSEGNLFLERLLSVLPLSRQQRVESAEPAGWESYDVVILDGVAPPRLPPGRYLILGAVPENLPLVPRGTVRNPRVLGWDRRHPVARSVTLEGVHIAEALNLEVRGGQTIVAGREGPLVWTYETADLRVVLLPFRLGASDLPLRAAFPVLVANAINWLSAGDAMELPAHVIAGRTVEIPVGPAADAVDAVGPAGRARLVAQGGRVLLPALQTGIYRVRLPQGDLRLAANLSDPEESRIAPRGRLVETAGGGMWERVHREWWLFVAMAALGALLAEGTLTYVARRERE